MDHLRTDVNLRTVGQRDPLMEFKHDAFLLFDEFGRTLRSETAQDLFRFEIVMQPRPSVQELLANLQLETNRSFLPELDSPQAQQEQPSDESSEEQFNRTPAEKQQPILVGAKTGRNEKCPCGSGKKYKSCCGLTAEE